MRLAGKTALVTGQLWNRAIALRSACARADIASCRTHGEIVVK